ncbi:DUF3168 domain-containing protein [Sphingomonas sp. S1-29]|uniref:tail completion protein gp17 n=1 Tax=Sphingomonas sp. S1-29 TaxID=2991074 RepID=UPI00223F43A2|nr:DUF3168 domain-containing protein [Sphingomonas sp. S1-29]UZK68663.1 DUF3168 domain-containing protein [Sphingomonas sp. S1-29]
MSAVLHGALVAALEAHAPLKWRLTAVFAAPPVRSAMPYALVTESVVADWSTKDQPGIEARVAIELHDGGEVPGRLRGLAEAAGAALAAMPRDLGEGWRMASLVPLRTRVVRVRGGDWVAVVEARVRMLHEGGSPP